VPISSAAVLNSDHAPSWYRELEQLLCGMLAEHPAARPVVVKAHEALTRVRSLLHEAYASVPELVESKLPTNATGTVVIVTRILESRWVTLLKPSLAFYLNAASVPDDDDDASLSHQSQSSDQHVFSFAHSTADNTASAQVENDAVAAGAHSVKRSTLHFAAIGGAAASGGTSAALGPRALGVVDVNR